MGGGNGPLLGACDKLRLTVAYMVKESRFPHSCQYGKEEEAGSHNPL